MIYNWGKERELTVHYIGHVLACQIGCICSETTLTQPIYSCPFSLVVMAKHLIADLVYIGQSVSVHCPLVRCMHSFVYILDQLLISTCTHIHTCTFILFTDAVAPSVYSSRWGADCLVILFVKMSVFVRLPNSGHHFVIWFLFTLDYQYVQLFHTQQDSWSSYSV